MDRGQDAILNYGTAGSTAGTLLGIVSVAGWSIENEGIEGKYRDFSQVNTEYGSQKIPTKFTMRRKPSDAGYAAIKAAAYNRTKIALKFTQKTGSTEIVDGDFVILKFTPTDESMDTLQDVAVECAVNTDIRACTVA